MRNWFYGLFGKRPQPLQVAALCTRKQGGKTEVLLITSRGTGRWIIPKGWPMKGRSLAGAAAQEAWEEAGVRGKTSPKALGIYHYDKVLDNGVATPVEVVVFRLKVESVEKRYPEVQQRKRDWFAPVKAATLVDEEGLRRILRDL